MLQSFGSPPRRKGDRIPESVRQWIYFSSNARRQNLHQSVGINLAPLLLRRLTMAQFSLGHSKLEEYSRLY